MAGRSRARWAEAVLVVVLFAGSAWWGARHVAAWREAGRPQAFYQEYFEPAVMLACGRGFVQSVPDQPPALYAFLRQRVDRFDCASLPHDLALTADGVAQRAWFYLMVTVAAAWKLLGISWSGLVPLFGLLFGTVIVLAYALFRVAVPPWVAVPPAVALAVSPLHLQHLPHLRDYAKAPFVLALVLLLFWLVRRPLGPRALLAGAAVYGAVLGVGYGFRTDLLANIPPFVAAVLLFAPGGLRRHLRARLAAVGVGLVVCATVSWPAASYVVRHGGCQWHVVLLGLDDAFTRALQVRPSVYQWTSAYSDEYMHTAVNSYLFRTQGRGPVGYCSTEYDAASGAYWRAIVAAFPADVLVRAYASIERVMGLPFYWWQAVADEPDRPRRSAAGELLTYVARAARLAVPAAVVAIAAVNLRLGLFALCVLLYFGAYPSLQFASRHYFHLEFLGWWAMAFLAWQALRLWRRWPDDGLPASGEVWHRMAARGALFAAGTVALVAIPLPVARAYQDREARQMIRTLLEAPRVEVPLVLAEEGWGLRSVGPNLGSDGADATATAYLDVQFDLDACPERPAIGLRYDSSRPLHDFSAPIRASPPGTRPARVLVPVYRGFQGLVVDEPGRQCVRRVERLASVRGLTLLPVLTLPEDWERVPLWQTLRTPAWWPGARATGAPVAAERGGEGGGA